MANIERPVRSAVVYRMHMLASSRTTAPATATALTIVHYRFVQQSSNGSRNGSATRDSASAGGGAVGASTNRPAVNSANRASGRTEVRHSVCVYTTILQHVQQRTHCSSSGACSTEHI